MLLYQQEDNDMGLDSMWCKNDTEAGEIEGEFKVWSGGFSDNGNTSFRGKVYYSIVEEITNVSLYDDVITNDQCKEMLERFDNFDFSDICQNPYALEQNDYDDFVRMFRLHVEAGHFLMSCY